MSNKVASKGFTLLEVIVALAVVTLALAALVSAVGQQTKNFQQIRAQTYAEMVASNALAEARLRDSWPEIGETNGQELMAGQRFDWRLLIQPTQAPELRRMQVSVSVEGRGRKVATVAERAAFAAQR
jgi:general secretion pathway protein I